MTTTIIESPHAAPTPAGVARNVEYARACLKDSLLRGEAPIASHLLYTQVLDDTIPAERTMGIDAGLAWRGVADRRIFYTDLGWSPGMRAAQALYNSAGLEWEERRLKGWGKEAAGEGKGTQCP